MVLFETSDRYPNRKDLFLEGDNLKGTALDACAHGKEERVGRIYTVLTDDSGQVCDLVITTGFWIFSKKVCLPIGRCIDDPEKPRIYAVGLTKQQVRKLPEYSEKQLANGGRENYVRSDYLIPGAGIAAPVIARAAEESA